MRDAQPKRKLHDKKDNGFARNEHGEKDGYGSDGGSKEVQQGQRSSPNQTMKLGDLLQSVAATRSHSCQCVRREVLQVTIALPKDLNGDIEKFRHVLGVTASM
jgi:hypothetical protein